MFLSEAQAFLYYSVASNVTLRKSNVELTFFFFSIHCVEYLVSSNSYPSVLGIFLELFLIIFFFIFCILAFLKLLLFRYWNSWTNLTFSLIFYNSLAFCSTFWEIILCLSLSPSIENFISAIITFNFKNTFHKNFLIFFYSIMLLCGYNIIFSDFSENTKCLFYFTLFLKSISLVSSLFLLSSFGLWLSLMLHDPYQTDLSYLKQGHHQAD